MASIINNDARKAVKQFAIAEKSKQKFIAYYLKHSAYIQEQKMVDVLGYHQPEF